MKTKLLLLIAFGVLISACAAPSTPAPIMTEIPAGEILPTEPTQPPVQAEPSPTGENIPGITMATYTDDAAGFSIDYPANWFLESSAAAHADQSYAYSISVANWDINNPPTPSGKGESGIPEGGIKIDVGVTKQPMTLEEAVVQQEQNESGNPILAREDVTLANGLPGVILDMEGFAGLTRTLIVSLNGNIIYVSGYGNLEHFEPIALSLRAK